jgi:cell division septum initiation protein DivIVA
MERPEFTISRKGGYEIDEVDAYLATVEQRWRAQFAGAQDQIDRLNADLATARQSEEAIHLTLVAATKTKEEMVGAAQRQLDEATSRAREEADKITAEAEYQAFQLLNDAKEKAAELLSPANAEAHRIVEEARREAETTLSEARREAITIITEIKQEGQRLVSDREAELRSMNERFERDNSELMRKVAVLQAVTTDMEARLQAIANGNIDDLISIAALITADIDPHNGVKLSRQSSSHSSAPAPSRSTERAEEPEPEERGSYYSRHSAKLPRLGTDGSSVFAAVSALRERTFAGGDDDDDDTGIDDDEDSRELIRTA